MEIRIELNGLLVDCTMREKDGIWIATPICIPTPEEVKENSNEQDVQD